MANVAPMAVEENNAPDNNVNNWRVNNVNNLQDDVDVPERIDSGSSVARRALGLPDNQPVDREDLINRGMSAPQVDAVVVRRHQNEVLGIYFRRWMFFFLFVLCILGPTSLGLLIWLVIAWNDARGKTARCDQPLIEWVSVLYAFKMYYFFLHQLCIRCVCKFNPNQEPRPPTPARVVFYNVLLALFDFGWNITGIILAATSTDCKEKMSGLYNSTLSFASVSIFLTLFMVVNTIGIHSILAYMMRNGMLKNNQAAPSGTLEAQKLVKFDSPLLKEEDGSIGSCPICFEEWTHDQEMRQTSCNHCFHTKCLKGWLGVNHTCPLCRCDLRIEGAQGSTIGAPQGAGQRQGLTGQP